MNQLIVCASPLSPVPLLLIFAFCFFPRISWPKWIFLSSLPRLMNIEQGSGPESQPRVNTQRNSVLPLLFFCLFYARNWSFSPWVHEISRFILCSASLLPDGFMFQRVCCHLINCGESLPRYLFLIYVVHQKTPSASSNKYIKSTFSNNGECASKLRISRNLDLFLPDDFDMSRQDKVRSKTWTCRSNRRRH